MRFLNIAFKTIFFIFLVLAVAVFSLIIVLSNGVSDDYKIKKGETFSVSNTVPVTASYNGATLSQGSKLKSIGENIDVELKLFGIIPLKTVNVEIVDEMYVEVLGNPFGMKIYTDGVLVVNFTSVESENGLCNPAKSAGIKEGDYILSVNSREITTNEELSEWVESSNGNSLKFEIMRNNKKLYINVKPIKSVETNSYKIGMWVRDSSAGIGTLTFYSPATGVLCGLGHGICDSDTGELLSVERGELVGAEIISVTKGAKGSAGELHGRFAYNKIADILLNSDIGVYGKLSSKIDFKKLVEIALKQEIKNGDAEILCAVDGDVVRSYDCTVKKRSAAYFSNNQNLLVTITDKDLIEKTGGIVQGMSGSPIIQNGKLIGAVTHVLVDDPTKGYAIFAENMLETAQSVAQENLKEAS